MVSAVVRDDLVTSVHEDPKRTIGRLDNHNAGVEDGVIIADGGNLREVKEKVEVAKDDDVGVDEDDLVIISELPQPELAVIVFIIRVLLGPRVSDPGYDPDLPPGCGQGGAFGHGDRLVHQQDKVAFGSGFEKALCQRYGAAHVGF